MDLPLFILGYMLTAGCSFYILWLFFLAAMNLKRVNDAGKLRGLAYYMGVPVVAIGLGLDWFCNAAFMTMILWELPQETTVTARLKRHKSEGSAWSKAVALWFEPILDPFDPSGDHI